MKIGETDMIDWKCRNPNCGYDKVIHTKEDVIAYPICPQCKCNMLRVTTSDSVLERCKAETARLGTITPDYYHGRAVMNFINEFQLGYCLGNVLTYIARHRKKNGVEDLKKAKWYLDEQIRLYETGEEQP